MKTNQHKQKTDDQQWMETHVLKGGDLLLYGSLSEESDTLFNEILWKELRQASQNYINAGKARTKLFHKIIDDKLEELLTRDKRYGYPPPFCHKGCSNCCHEVIFCTDEEAQLIHEHCQKNNILIDYPKLERQLKFIKTNAEQDHDGITTWSNQKEEDQSCIFLNQTDNACTIWSERPFVCRVHLAENTDLYCRPYNGQVNPNAVGINYPEWSYILTAIFTIHRTSIKKTMGRLLLNFVSKGR